MPQMTACFLPQGQRGRYDMIRLINAAFPYSMNSCVFWVLPPIDRLPKCRYRKIREDDSDPPPETGGHAVPCSGAMRHAPIPAPGGRYRRYLSLREGSETGQIGSAAALRFGCPLFPLPG